LTRSGTACPVGQPLNQRRPRVVPLVLDSCCPQTPYTPVR